MIIKGGNQCLMEFSVKASVVGDAVHYVAAAEALGVLERSHIDALPRLEVNQFGNHSGCADVDHETVDPLAVASNHFARVVN